MNRNARSVLHQRRSRIGRRARATEAVEFFNVLTSPELLATTEALLPEHRERLYPPTVALSMFMRQVLEADGSCQKAVNGWAVLRKQDKRPSMGRSRVDHQRWPNAYFANLGLFTMRQAHILERQSR